MILDPRRVVPGSIIFIDASFLEFFFSAVFKTLRHPVILITQNSDLPAPGKFAHYLDHPNIIHWFGQNCDIKPLHPKFTPIPIGLGNPQWKNGKTKIHDAFLKELAENSDWPRKNLIYINVRGRVDVVAQVEKNNFSFTAGPKPFKDYFKEMATYRYVLSPFGAGLDCFRTWEALLVGCVPVVKTSGLDPLYQGLPVVILDDWSECTEEIVTKKYEQLKNRPVLKEKLFMDYWARLIIDMKKKFLA
ncbi:MAG: hypothetical protein US69_C0013G0016 [candidate division TM6 bacterium GW2011_GWF2_38_10]|nr:MAG: hypothetical protein US69_C0013G0016 [candidate division TM6 bacterium GW2011_GWF2_38_10]